jgi:hypothetical protein
MNSYIKLWRSIMEWEWYRDPNTARVFIHLLLIANHKQSKWQGITVEAGQAITSSDSLAHQTGLTRQNIRTSLTRLKSTNEITITSTNKYTLITITNWASYQMDSNELTSSSTSTSTTNQPATNQQLTTNKKVRNNIYKRVNSLMPTTVITKVIDLWNGITETNPKARGCAKKRAQMIEERYLENGSTTDAFLEVFTMVKESAFLSGATGGKFVCTIDWVLNADNWLKICEGNYIDKQLTMGNQKSEGVTMINGRPIPPRRQIAGDQGKE